MDAGREPAECGRLTPVAIMASNFYHRSATALRTDSCHVASPVSTTSIPRTRSADLLSMRSGWSTRLDAGRKVCPLIAATSTRAERKGIGNSSKDTIYLTTIRDGHLTLFMLYSFTFNDGISYYGIETVEVFRS